MGLLGVMRSLVCAAGLALAFGGAASAHSDLRAVVPENGSVLTASPTFVTLRFADPMRITFLRVVNQNGEETRILRYGDEEPTKEYTAEPALMGPGQYRVEWRGMAPDGHAMSGAFGFTIAQ